jgi:hypothetical protein
MFNLKNQSLQTKQELKEYYGEVLTPYSLVEEMLNMLPNVWHSSTRWLDPACGTGYFFHVIYNRLFSRLSQEIPDERTRENHIQKMLTACEINSSNVEILRKDFPQMKIWNIDFLSVNPSETFDVIIGNPPYNAKGLKKVPTRKGSKRNDGSTIWTKFIRHSLKMLSPQGVLCMIVPSIWMKPDKAGIYPLLTRMNLKIRCRTNTETMTLFHKQAQTPTSIVCVQRPPETIPNTISLYDEGKWIPFHRMRLTDAIPTCYAELASLTKQFQDQHSLGSLSDRVIKTGISSKHTTFRLESDKGHPYANIRSCVLSPLPEWTFEYSSQPCQWYDVPKIVMAHKMYGYAKADTKGYGISRRDSYIIPMDPTSEDGKKLIAYLNTRFCRALFDCAKYRMRYLEKYAFEFIPDLLGHPKWETSSTEQITDEWLIQLFELSPRIIKQIQKIKLIH